MADVFLAQMAGPSGFSKLAVVKRLRDKLQNDDYMLSMFLDEGRLAARLNHQNVVNTYEVGHTISEGASPSSSLALVSSASAWTVLPRPMSSARMPVIWFSCSCHNQAKPER